MSTKKSFKDYNFILREERFRYVFSLSGLNQAQFSRVTGISQGSISSILKGLKWISKTAGILIERIYGINPDWLLTGEGKMFVGSGKSAVENSRQNSIGKDHPVSENGENKGSYTNKEIKTMENDLIAALKRENALLQELRLKDAELAEFKSKLGEKPAKRQAS